MRHVQDTKHPGQKRLEDYRINCSIQKLRQIKENEGKIAQED